MRLVCVADTHLFEDPGSALPAGDVLIHAGDMLRAGSLAELDYAAEWISRQAHSIKIVIAGNHDWCFARTPGPARARLGDDVIYLEGREVTAGGLRIWGGPWQPEFFGWAFNLPRGPELAAKWAQIPKGLDLLVTHGPPRGFGDRAHGQNLGCDDLLAAVRRARPAVHLFGHIHEDGGVWTDGDTTFVNVTTWECSRGPTVLDYDPGTRTLAPVHIPPRA